MLTDKVFWWEFFCKTNRKSTGAYSIITSLDGKLNPSTMNSITNCCYMPWTATANHQRWTMKGQLIFGL